MSPPYSLKLLKLTAFVLSHDNGAEPVPSFTSNCLAPPGNSSQGWSQAAAFTEHLSFEQEPNMISQVLMWPSGKKMFVLVNVWLEKEPCFPKLVCFTGDYRVGKWKKLE